MEPTERNYKTNLVIFFICLVVAMIFAGCVGRAFAANHNFLGVVLAILAGGWLWMSIARYGLSHTLMSIDMKVDRENKAKAVAEQKLIRQAAAKVESERAGAEVQANSPKENNFSADTYFQATYIDTNLDPWGFAEVIQYHQAMLTSHPLIVLVDKAIHRYVVLRNQDVKWAKAINIAAIEKDLVSREVTDRAGKWVDSWVDQIGDASAADLEKSMAAQGKESFLTWLRDYLTGNEVGEAMGSPEMTSAGHSVLDVLTGPIDGRGRGVERLCAKLLQRKPACIEIPMDGIVDLPRGAVWTDEAILERFILGLPFPGWLAFKDGPVALLYEVGGASTDGYYNGTVIENEVIRGIINGAVFEATGGLSEQPTGVKMAKFALENFASAR